MKRKTRNAAKTKKEIIEKSAPVFNVNGYSGTKIQQVLDATGYTMGGIYRHFKDKKELALAVFEYNVETLVKRNLELSEELNPREKLLTIIKNYKNMIMNPVVAGGCPLLNTATEMDDKKGEKKDEDFGDFREMTKGFVKEILGKIEGILDEGKNNGFFKPDIDPKKEALYLFASFEGAILIGNITRSGSAIFAVFEQIEKYLEDSIFKN